MRLPPAPRPRKRRRTARPHFFSRLGRSLGQIATILDALAKAGVAFVALKENIRVDGERDIQTKVMTTLFALFAEVERDIAKITGVSRTALYSFMSTRGLRPSR